jgi:hypothetical protein
MVRVRLPLFRVDVKLSSSETVIESTGQGAIALPLLWRGKYYQKEKKRGKGEKKKKKKKGKLGANFSDKNAILVLI